MKYLYDASGYAGQDNDISSMWGVPCSDSMPTAFPQWGNAVDANPSHEEFSPCLDLYLRSFFPSLVPDSGEITTASQSIPEILCHVKKTFSLSIMELSSILDVSRPTVYAYMKGDSQPERDMVLSRLMVLEEFAHSVERSGLKESYAASLLSRRDSGLSLKERIQKDIFVTENIPAYIKAEETEKNALVAHADSLMKKRKRKDSGLSFIIPHAFPEEHNP
ncbi:MAG: hypothetical protein WCQ66_00150 [Sphaerochaetaceae bacterium]